MLVTRGGGDLGHMRGDLGDVGHAHTTTTAKPYQWKNGICYNTATGVPYSGDQKLSNCYSLYGPYKAPTGGAAVYDFFKKTFLGEGGQQYAGQPSITSSSLVMPAVVVVGGVALFLILRKKK